MQTRALGRTGLTVAPVIFGGNVFGWTIDEATSFAVLDAFVDHGFNAIDTADVYSAWAPGNRGGESETIIGRWLKARPGMRDRVTIFTKVGSEGGAPKPGGLTAAWIASAAEASLTRLGIETIDLYFSHWPDPEGTPQEETLAAHERLIAAGKVRAIGASNYTADMLRAAKAAAETGGLPGYQVVQPGYNLHDRAGYEGELQAFCQAEGLGVVTYFSLASGFLSGKYRQAADLAGAARGGRLESYLTPRGMAILDALALVADRHGAAPAEVALAWLMAQPGVTAPIASATRVAQVESFARAATLRLSEADLATLSI